MAFKLAWCTDIHLNFLKHLDAQRFFGEYLAAEEPDAGVMVVTGDISETPTLESNLQEFEAGWGRPMYFVLGNHDYYDGSFEEGHEIANTFDGWLNGKSAVELTPKVCLVGNEGWYDAQYGQPYARFGMSDWILIKDLVRGAKGNVIPGPMRQVSHEAKTNLIKTCQDRSAALTAEARANLEDALKRYETVVFATHYPPFDKAAWHEGQMSGSMWLPWFTSKNMGTMLREVAHQHKDRRILVLCGHTHGAGVYRAAKNLQVFTGEAVYGAPDLAGLLEIEEDGSLRIRRKQLRSWVSEIPFS